MRQEGDGKQIITTGSTMLGILYLLFLTLTAVLQLTPPFYKK
jgi:hypothetical protein